MFLFSYVVCIDEHKSHTSFSVQQYKLFNFCNKIQYYIDIVNILRYYVANAII